MSDTAKHPIAPIESETSTATQERAPGVQLKVREENVSQGDERGETREGGWGDGGRGGRLGTGATGNSAMLQSTEEALKGC